MQAEGVGDRAFGEALKDSFSVLELPLEILIDLIFQLRRDQPLAIIVPIGIDPHQQMPLFPVDGVAMDIAFARARRVEPVADEAVFPDGRSGVVSAGNQPRMRSADGLSGE